jgi:heterodisulfide reductase subunit A
MSKDRIGIFVCHCGRNIADTVDVQAVVDAARDFPGVVHAEDYAYMCSDPGQALIREAIAAHDLNAVVVAACSPAMHQATFRKTAASAGMNAYRLESANIREQVSWVHRDDPERATQKAIETVRALAAKVRADEALDPISIDVTRRALVIGGGIAGLVAAKEIADAGYSVILVEREPQLGGRMRQLSGTYLNFDAAPDLLAKRVEAVAHHPNVQVLTGAEVESLEGYVGNFEVHIAPTPAREGGEIIGQPFTFQVGAVIAATGWRPYPLGTLPEYGGGDVLDVIDFLAFESMLAPGNEIRRPSDGRTPREVVFVQCAGSRDPERGVSYCSKVCCMVVPKQAMMLAERVPGAQSYVFYIDIRSAGKNYDEYVQRAMEDERVMYLRGKVSRIFREGDKVLVWGADTLSGQALEIAADLVVLATPMLPERGARELAARLRISTDSDGFYNEAHPKLRPVETLTAGVYVAGVGQGPKDIPEVVAEAGAAAGKVLGLFAQEKLAAEPTVAAVEADICSACGACVEVCPYGAREIDPLRQVAMVRAALCEGCGACVAACPNKASSVRNRRPDQILDMADLFI